MKQFFFFPFILFATLLISCKAEVDPEVVVDSFISGTWKMAFNIQTTNKTDDLKLTMFIPTGSAGAFTGTGDITYSGLTGATSFSYTIKDNATGTYSTNDIKVTVLSSISGNKFEFVGTRDNSASATTYRGTVTLTINGTATVFTNSTLFKSAS